MDGCCEEGDTIEFSLPLRGASSRFLGPTFKNMYKKFSLHFFILFIFFVRVRLRVAAKAKESDNNGESSEKNMRGAIDGDSDLENIESFVEQSEVSSDFIEID